MKTCFVQMAAGFAAAWLFAPAAWGAGEVLSLNVAGGNNNRAGKSITSGKTAGVKAVDAAFWTQALAGQNTNSAVNTTLTSLKEWSEGAAEAADRPVRVQLRAACCWTSGTTATNGDSELLYGYLDDGTTDTGYGAQILLTNMPYTQYDVYVYFGSDTAGSFGPVEVNGTWYPNGASTAWGDRSTARQEEVTLTENGNYVKISGLTASELAIKGATKGSYRTGLAGVQIVNTGDVIEVSSFARTVTADGSWQVGEAAEDWGAAGTTAPESGSEVTLTVNADAALTMNAAASVGALTIAGSGKLTFAADGDSTHTLTASSTAVNTDVDASAGVASLGVVTVAEGKTLTVKTADAFSAWESGSGILETTGDTAVTAAKFANVKQLLVSSGTLTSASWTGAQALGHGRTITVSGESAKLLISIKDGTGWSASGGRIILNNGGTLEYGARDSLHTPITLCGGTLALGASAAESSRALDIFLSDANTADFTVNALEGATAVAPTVSYLKALGTGNNARVLLRDGSMIADVAENARFVVSAGLVSSVSGGSSGTPGALIKQGAGELELSGSENTYTTGTQIQAGTLKLSGSGTLGTGAAAVSEGAALELAVAEGEETKTLANVFTGAGAITKTGAGAAKLSGNLSGFTGTITLTAGALDVGSATVGETKPTFAFGEGATGTLTVPAGAEGTVTVPAGAALKLVLSAAQVLEGYTASGVTLASEGEAQGTIAFVNAAGETITEGVNGTTYTAPLNTWTPAEASADGTYRWSTAANWSTGTVPAEADNARISISGDTTLTLDADVTAAGLAVEGSGTLTLAGSALNVSGVIVCKTDVTAAIAALADKTGTIQVEEGKVLTLNSETVVDNPDNFGSAHAIALPAITGSGSVVKTGAGAVVVVDRALEPAITLQAGALHLRGSENAARPSRLDITAKNGTEVRFTAWAKNEDNSLNSFRLEGGSKMVLGNGLTENSPRTISGAVTLVQATDENPVRIYGSAFGPVQLNTSIGLAEGETSGVLEFAEGEQFNSTYACNHAVLVGGVISGNIAVRVSEQANGVTFSGANTYTGGTEITEGAALTISNRAGVGTSGTITGAGTLKVTGAYSGNTNVNPLANVSGLTEAGWTGTVLLAVTGSRPQLVLNTYGHAGSVIELNGAQGWIPGGTVVAAPVRLTGNGLQLTNGSSSALTQVTFSKVEGDGSLLGPSGNAWVYALLLQDVSAFTGNMDFTAGGQGGAFAVLIGSAFPSDYAHNAYKTHLTILADGTASIAQGKTWKPATGASGTVRVYGSLGGTGTVASALAYYDGATLDATAGALTVTGAVTYGDSLMVKLPAAPDTAGTQVLVKAGVGVPSFALLALTDGSVATALLVAKEDGLYAVKPTVIPPSGTETLDDAVTDAVAAAAAKAGVVSVSVAEGSADINGVALFTGLTPVVTPSAEDAAAGTVSVAYAFGISELRVVELNGAQAVILCAKVQAEKGADFADGTALEVLSGAAAGDASAMTAVATARALTAEELTALGLTLGAGERYLYVMPFVPDMTSAAFCVRATNAQTAGE